MNAENSGLEPSWREGCTPPLEPDEQPEVGQVWEVRSFAEGALRACLVLDVTGPLRFGAERRTWVRLLDLLEGEELTCTTARWHDPVMELVGERLL